MLATLPGSRHLHVYAFPVIVELLLKLICSNVCNKSFPRENLYKF